MAPMKRIVYIVLAVVMIAAASPGAIAQAAGSAGAAEEQRVRGFMYTALEPQTLQEMVTNSETLVFDAGYVRISLNSAALKFLTDANFAKIFVIIEAAAELGFNAYEALLDNPAYTFMIQGEKADGGMVNVTELEKGSAEISINYTLKADERAADVRIARIGYDGAVDYPDSSYDEVWATAVVNRLSSFGVNSRTTADYTDTVSHPRRDVIRTARRLELMEGTSENRFSPDQALTYEAVAAILGRLMGVFDDSTPDSWFEWACENGIFPESKTAPYSNISRGDMALMLYRFITQSGLIMKTDKQAAGYNDLQSVLPEIREAAMFLQKAGIVTDKNTAFMPGGAVTRSDAALLLTRMLENQVTSGWHRNELGQMRYLGEDGAPLTGMHVLNRQIYYFDDNGYMAYNRWVETGGKSFYFNIDGRMLNDTINGTYKIGDDGEIIISVPYAGVIPPAVWYINEAGEQIWIPCDYDWAAGIVTFIAASLNTKFMIGNDPDAAEQLSRFSDVEETSWFYGAVMFAYSHGLMTGTSTNPMMFSPNATTTRGMIVTILYRMAGRPDVSGLVNPFGDVADDKYYADAVIWAAANGIVSGYGGGLFGPEDNITREQLAAILNSYAAKTGMTLPDSREYSGFNDEADIAYYAKDAIERFYRAGIISGKPGNVFDPKGGATRAEVTTMLMNFLAETDGE